MMPDLVIFDLDGTLVEFHHDYLFSETHRILERMGHPPVNSAKLHETFASFDYFAFLGGIHRDEFVQRFWELFDWNNFPPTKPFPYALEAMVRLRSLGIPVAIVTARYMPAQQLLSDLAHTGFPDVITHLITRPGDHVHWTDKRRSILEMCLTVGVDPARTVMVGDIPTDITSAHDVGVGTAVSVLSGGINREILELAHPHYIIEGVGELCGLFER